MAKKFENTVFVRSPYNYDMGEASDKSGLKCEDPTLTQQHFAEESDINFIAERFGLTGEMPQVLDLPKYGDFNGIFDFQTAQNQVVEANRQFMTLPAKLRAHFNNDPQQLLAFLDDESNRPMAEALGLVEKKKPEDELQSRVDAPGAPDRANPAPDPDKPSERSTTKTDKKSKTDT